MRTKRMLIDIGNKNPKNITILLPKPQFENDST